MPAEQFLGGVAEDATDRPAAEGESPLRVQFPDPVLGGFDDVAETPFIGAQPVLGLLAGGSCRGLAHRLPARDYDRVRRYLWTREIENDGVYEEAVRPIHLADGRVVPSLVYLADRRHRQFAGKLPLSKAVRLVRQGKGATGRNIEYVRNTVAHLRELGLRDRALEELAQRAGR